ncbi:histidine kinase [Chitinophaga filiformis]|uniref:sensor histidine kinase n=1 Tax=Chitinophaga filiformis TaxID=104663 RepID=UPI001F3675DD|nr:histidine kinase [Chitinophaga filiformis]MCF6404128.1 histidine kinase [Chitinophaga filiformis]
MMSSTIDNSLIARRRYFYAAYWVMVTLIFLYDRTYLIQKAGLPNFFICVVVRVSLLIALAWANIHWLIPHYLLRGRYSGYFALVFLLLIAYLLVQSFYDYYLFGYVLGPSRYATLSTSLIYNFTHTSLYLLLTVALKFSMDWYEQKKLLQEIQVEKLQAEVNYLRSQVNPHFLFNALNNLYALTLKKSDEAPEVVLKLAGLMEYMLYESDETKVPLEKEINYLNNYLELEKIRQGNNADIRLTVTGNIEQCWIPPFLILPLVENAFKHGVSRTVRNAYLHIRINVSAILEICIENNKGNIQQPAQSGGIGLLNLKKRLELLFPGKHVLDITDGPDKYQVALKINL